MATETQIAISNFNSVIKADYWQSQLKSVLGANSGTFATSLVEVFSNDEMLQKCDPKAVMKEAIKAATLKLPMTKALGYAYLIPYGKTPTLIVGYKGYVQLAIRSGLYKNINADVVYEGELLGFDKVSGAVDLSGEKTSDRVLGYFAHFELTNGFSKTLYMSLEQMAKYAIRYSPTCKKSTVEGLINKAQEQADNGIAGNGVGWFADFNSMATKTCLRRLLGKYGYLSVEMEKALSIEIENESAELKRDNAQDDTEVEDVTDLTEVESVNTATGEVTIEECPI